ncbi:MAG: glycine--tRNA ligase subunit beta [Candidatus Melainabacteria bacterium GWF2_37_15]|nr:MAG: glycine--tRNA ligase subunit beta [Candidatus Melainabacteria bacterium GWF2_37_15]
MVNYLLEIGTEELPYNFVTAAQKQLKQAFSDVLKEARMEFKQIKTYGTPRRLCIVIEDIAEVQPDLVKEVKGPPANIAFNENGGLTKAGEGFAKKQGLSPKDLGKKVIDNTEYVWAEIKETGKPTEEVLETLVPELILKLQGSHFMRWADLDIKFSRPIRWLVSILDSKEVKITIGNVESGKESRGHRFSELKAVKIQNPDTYLDDLYKVKVIADSDKRREEIVKQINDAAKSVGGVAKIDARLLEEVTNLVEWPNPVIGNFDKKYLEVTTDVTVSVLAHHQRYFPVYDQNGKLLNYFITIANHDSTNIDNIRKGNEKVVKARLDDAIFFYKEDTKKPLEAKVDELKGVTFQKGLGSVYDKMLRIQKMSASIADELNLSQDIKDKIQRTAYLCKADLVTNLVREFTELQGIIGADYARLSGEDKLVAEGIKEHYMPVSADGELADTITGQVVGIADKLDTICGVFSLGKAPTGSADPLGLRRAALGIIKTIIEKGLNLNLSKFIENPEIKEFFIQRLRILLNEKYKYDVVDAVLGAKDPLIDLKDVMHRLEVVNQLIQKESYKQFHESANRIQRIIKGHTITGNPQDSLFQVEAEKKLWKKAQTVELEELVPYIEKFFDDVLVMDKDEAIKQNRLNLLGFLNERFMQIADFSKIVY